MIIEAVNGMPQSGELAAMQHLYTHDAVEAYSRLVDNAQTQEQLRDYFTTKAENLPEALADPNQKFWLARWGASVVGMAGYNAERRLIHSVYVSDQVRGQGIGSRLLQRTLDGSESSDLSRTVLVAQANAQAIAFYQRHNFQLTGNVKAWEIGQVSIPELELESKRE